MYCVRMQTMKLTSLCQYAEPYRLDEPEAVFTNICTNYSSWFAGLM